MAEMSSRTSRKVVAKTDGDKPAAKKPAAAKTTSAKKPADKAAAKTASTSSKTAAAKTALEPGAVKAVVARKRAEKPAAKVMTVSDEQRYRMVAEAAYYRAEANHFKSDPLRDWIEAESDIAALLSGAR